MNQTYVSVNPHDEQFVSTFLEIPYRRTLRQVLDYGISDGKQRIVFGLHARYDLRERFLSLPFAKFAPVSWTMQDTIESVFSGMPHFSDLLSLLSRLESTNPHTVSTIRISDGGGIDAQFMRQLDLRNVERLHCCVYQQYASMLRVPAVLEHCALLLRFLASWLGIQPGFLVHTIGIAELPEIDADKARELLNLPVHDSPYLSLSWPQEICVGPAAFLKTVERWPKEKRALLDAMNIQLTFP